MKFFFALGACLYFANVGFAATPLSLNLAQSLADTKAKLSAGGQADIMMIGDSLEFNVMPYFQQDMHAQYGDAGAGYQGFSVWSGAGEDPGWTRGLINGDVDPHMSLDGLWSSTNVATSASFLQEDESSQLQYVAQPGGGSFTYDVYGTPHNVSTASTTVQLKSVTITGRPDWATNPYWISTAGTGTVTILGQENVTTNSGVRIDRTANGGWGVANFLQRDQTFDLQMKLVNPDLVTVWLGQNDQSYSRSDYGQKLTALLARIRTNVPNAEVVFIGTYDQGSPNLHQLVDAMADVAQTNDVGFINLFDTAGSAKFMNDMGYLADGIHFSQTGSAYMGDLLYQTFLTDGANLTPEPSCLSVLAIISIGLTSRIRKRSAV